MNRILFIINCVVLIGLIIATTDKPITDMSVENKRNSGDTFKRVGRLQAAEPMNIQVNRIPHPFNLNGRLPFQVWVDGERVPLNMIEVQDMIEVLDIEFTQPEDTKEIHSGAGWIFPHAQ